MLVHRTAYAYLLIGVLLVLGGFAAADEPLMDWSAWQKYRKTVEHPTGYINAQDLKNARENIKRYEWAEKFARNAEEQVIPYLDRFTPEFLEKMIPTNTAQRCWPCPACRDKKLPSHPGGDWNWSIDDPEHIKCKLCGTVFPNDEYAETIVLKGKSKWGKGQTFSYYGGETFVQWGYPHYRPSFSGMVRRYKISWSRDMASNFAMTYALTEKPEYAEVVRKILLRFAEVYPNYLLLTAYGEIADMDPHVAGLAVNNLPEDELVYPPNKPDRKIYDDYWTASRIGVGTDGDSFTIPMLTAYELTYNARKADGTPLYTEQERIRIERDVILESCVHLIGEKDINNKSVFNRTAVGMVGISLGHPGLTRFGLEGWNSTMDKWFLADGCTPESPSYAGMALRGIDPFPQAVRGYSDPPGYADEKGERIDGLNLYEGKYKLIWQRMFEGLQGNLRYPPYADSHRTTTVELRHAELMAANYPDNLQYLSLLKAYAGDDLSKGDPETALFFRKPGLEKEKSPPLHFEDNFFPALCLGQFRTGLDGRESLTLLSATHWGTHHHADSLNLYYWKDGHELLTDLGYLWDHPMSSMTVRTFAHNTGMVDLKEQKAGWRENRNGRFRLFHTGGIVKVMEASSQAYDNADVFDRTVIQIDCAPLNSYIVDLFRLRADGSRDLVYHGPNNDYTVSGITLADFPPKQGGVDLKNIKSAPSPASWTAAWKMAEDMQFSAYHCGQEGEVTYIGDGWGQRSYRNSDIGATVPYIVRRHQPKAGVSTFCTVYEAHSPGKGLVKAVSRSAVPEQYADNIVVLEIKTTVGTDLVISQLAPATVEIDTPLGKVRTDARVTVISVRDGKAATAALTEGNIITLDGKNLPAERLKPDKSLADQAPAKEPY